MTTDNRTNGPTPEQVEVAAVASINSHRSRAGLPTLAALDGVPNADEWRDDARPALVAAQGAATQAEIPVQAFADWHERWWRNEPDTIQKANAQAAFFAGWDARGAVSVLPSSGVDEGKIESLILGRTATAGARAVAEWLKEQGR